MLRKCNLIGLFVLNNNYKRTKMWSGRVGKAIVLKCFFKGQLRLAQEIGGGFLHSCLSPA